MAECRSVVSPYGVLTSFKYVLSPTNPELISPQLKILQIGLADNPRRNALTALQYSLANSIDLLKYVLTIVLSDPSQFKYAALVSWVAVLGGALAYLSYVKQQRGHVLHLGEWQTLLKKHR